MTLAQHGEAGITAKTTNGEGLTTEGTEDTEDTEKKAFRFPSVPSVPSVVKPSLLPLLLVDRVIFQTEQNLHLIDKRSFLSLHVKFQSPMLGK